MEHFDLAAFYGGSATELYRTLGAHRTPDGWVFRVWAPHAGSVSVVGDFCAWDPTAHPMRRLDGGIWETEVAGLSEYDTYKFAVTAQSGAVTFKADPYAFHAETRPGTASKLYELAGYDWGDGAYLAAKQPVYDRPLNIYEVHLGSWRRRENGDFYDYRSLADELSEYAADLGYNCVELMPGVIPKILRRLCERVSVPVIAGGLIETKEEIIAAINAGAAAVSTTNQEVWEL